MDAVDMVHEQKKAEGANAFWTLIYVAVFALIFEFAWDWSGHVILNVANWIYPVPAAAFEWAPGWWESLGLILLVGFLGKAIQELTPKFK